MAVEGPSHEPLIELIVVLALIAVLALVFVEVLA